MTAAPFDDALRSKLFYGMPVIGDPYVPKDTVYVLNGSQTLIACMMWIHRRRFWYKPWTWLRKNKQIDWWRQP